MSYFIVQKAAKHYAGKARIVLDIAAIGGRPFSETTIENITLRPEDGQPPAYQFKAEAITCRYNLWDIKKGYGHFLQGLSCTAKTPEFIQDLTVSMPEDDTASALKMLPIPAVLPRFDIYGGSVNLLNSGWDVEIHGINGSLRSAAAVHELQLEVDSFHFRQDGLTRIETGFASLFRYGDEKLSIDSFEIAEQEISATGIFDLAQIAGGGTEFAADVAFSQSNLHISGSLKNHILQTRIKSEDFDVAELQKRLGGFGWDVSGKIQLVAEIDLNLEKPSELHGSYVLDLEQGSLHGVDIETVSLEGVFDRENAKVSVAAARTKGNQVLIKDISVSLPLLQTAEPLSIIGGSRAQFSLSLTDVAEILQLIKIDRHMVPDIIRQSSATVSGLLERKSVRIDEAKAVTGDTRLVVEQAIMPIPATRESFASLPIHLKALLETNDLAELTGPFTDNPVNGQITAEMVIEGSLKNANSAINLTGDHLGYQNVQLGSLVLQAEVLLIQETPGTLKSAHITVSELVQTNQTGILTLAPPAVGTWQHEKFSLDAALELDGQGEAAIVIDKIPAKEMTAQITTRNLASGGWLGNFVDNRFYFQGADIEAVLTGPFHNPELQLGGSVNEAGATEVPFPLTGSFELQYSSKGLAISEFSWKSFERNELQVTGFLPFDPRAPEPFLDGDLALKGQVNFPSLEDIAVLLEPWGIGKGGVNLDMDLTGSWKQPQGHVLFQVEGLEPPDTMKKFIESPVNISVDIAAQGDSIALKSASLESKQYTAQATGFWRHGISVRELLRNRQAELKGEVSADASVQLKDLNFLRKNLPWLRRLEGDLRGELHVSGPVTDPAVTGSFSFKNGEVSHTFNFPMLSAVNLVGDFDEHSISIQSMQAEMGGSPVNLSGKIYKDNETVAVNLHADGKNVLLFRNNDLRLRGDMQLDVSGPLERLIIKGSTGLTGGYYTRNVNFLGMFGSSSVPVSEGVGFLFSFQDPPLKDAVIDIGITTIEPFRIRNNLIRGVLRPELSLKGTGELPFLVGNIYIDPSRVILPSGRLQVQSGLLRFLEAEPDRPQLDLLAQSKILGYDINVVTRGPFDDPVITLSSSPALPNDELLLLLLTGQPPKEVAAVGAKSRGTTNVMVYLGRDFLNKWLEDESGASDETILDRFELDFGRNITKSGEQTIESAFRLSEFTASTGKMYYLTGEKDKYDAYNYGMRLVFRFE